MRTPMQPLRKQWRDRSAHAPRSALACVLLAIGALAAPSGVSAANLYVAGEETAKVSQFSLRLDGTLAPLLPETVGTGSGPLQVAISPDAKSAYVTDTTAGTISQYDIGAGGVLVPKSPATVAVPGGASPEGIAVSPDGHSVYVASFFGEVSEYDVGADGALTPKTPATVPAGPRPGYVAVSPDGRSVYVTNPIGGTISEYDVGSGGVLTPKSHPTVPADSNPNRIAISPDGSSVYVTVLNGEEVLQYDVGAGGVLTAKLPPSVSSGHFSQGIVVSPDGGDVYVASEANNTIEHYTVAAGGVLSRLTEVSTAKEGPIDVAMSPDGRSLYTSVYYANQLNQYDRGPGGLLTAKLPAGVLTEEHPGGIAVTPDTGPGAAFTAAPSPAGRFSVFDASSSSGPYAIARYDWVFGDGTTAPDGGAAPSHFYAAPGTYTVSVRVTDSAGCSAAEVFTGQTAYCSADPGAVSSGTVTIPPAPVVSRAPVISGARQTASKWRRGSKLARISRHIPVGDTFSFSLNEAAAVRFAFYRQASGRRAGAHGRCVAPTRHNRHSRACTRSIAAGTLAFAGHAGRDKLAFQGRISRHKRLSPGRYVVTISATNAAGRRAHAVSLRFTIVG